MRDSNPRTPLVIESDWKLPAPVMRLGLSERSRTVTASDTRPYGGRPCARPGGTPILFLMLALALLPRTLWSASACDLNNDTRTDVIDVQIGLNQALGISTCSSADLSGNGQCEIVDVQRLINAALGQECRVGPDASVNPPQGSGSQPWERPFTAQRTHYVTTNGTGNGSIGSPESFATARGHCQAGDLHILRAGTYVGDFETGCDGTSSKPIVWKGYIDANGDPENAHIDGTWWLTGDWQWVWALHCGDANFSSERRDCFSTRAPGVSVINSVCQHHLERSCVGGWAFGPGQVFYGNILHDAQRAPGEVQGPHNMYAQNTYSKYGWKYAVRNIYTDATYPGSNQVFNSGWMSTSGARGSGWHIEDNAMVNGRLYHGQHNGGPASFTIGDPPIDHVVYKNNWFVGMNSHVHWHFGDNAPATGRFTQNLWLNSYIWMDAYWGAGSAAGCFSYPDISQFQNNRIYNPQSSMSGVASGTYLELRTKNFASNCNTTAEGTSKLRNADVWDNNTYGRSSGKGTFILGANGNTSSENTLAQWRTKTLAARENPVSSKAFDANSTEGGVPGVDEVECFDNFYQPNWGWCRAINWDGNGSITLPGAEVDKIIGNGKTYKVRNSRDFYGQPLETGTYKAGAGIVVSPLPTDTVSGVFTFYITSQP